MHQCGQSAWKGSAYEGGGGAGGRLLRGGWGTGLEGRKSASSMMDRKCLLGVCTVALVGLKRPSGLPGLRSVACARVLREVPCDDGSLSWF